jgi:hypothetical protein
VEPPRAAGAWQGMKRPRVSRRTASEGAPRAVSAAEEAARTAGPRVLTDAEKARLAAEASRIEDA